MRDVIQHVKIIEWMTVLILIALPFWIHFELFAEGDKLSLVLDWLLISGIVIGLVAYVIALGRNIRRAIANEEE